jgi:DNA-binding MarR family transcriptional regulator/ribosomal protein S18 acetylase RimI-like enzyme
MADMSERRHQDDLLSQAEILRDFNRYYTTRLGLLRRRYLGSQFSLTEARILYELAHGLEITGSSLRRLLGLDAGYISRLLNSLGKRGLIQKKTSLLDRRVSFLKLTSSGKREAARLNSLSNDEIEQLLRSLSEPGRVALMESVRSVRQILSASEHVDQSLEVTTVIRATVAQTADARELLKEYYREVDVAQRDTSSAIQSFLRDPDSGLWIAYVGDAPAGCVVLRPLTCFPSSAECKRLYVRASFRRRGLAEQLLEAMENHARQSELSWIYLDSKDDLKAAIALYRRRGYKPCKRYNENPQATVFLRKSIKT